MLAGAINTNVNALYALNALNNNTNTTSTLEQQLSTGLAINSPGRQPGRIYRGAGLHRADQRRHPGGLERQSGDLAGADRGRRDHPAGQHPAEHLQHRQPGGQRRRHGASSWPRCSRSSRSCRRRSRRSRRRPISTASTCSTASFQGINFQVGAATGQTIGLSLDQHRRQPDRRLSVVGRFGAGLYHTDGVGTGGVGDNTGASYAITSAGGGAFTAGTFGVSGSAGNANVVDLGRDRVGPGRRPVDQQCHVEHQRHGQRQHQRRLHGDGGFVLVQPRQRRPAPRRPTA